MNDARVTMMTGRLHGVTIHIPREEAKTLVGTGQARWAVEAPEARAPKVETPETPRARPLDSFTKEELIDTAEDRGVDVVRADGEDGAPLKSDYIAALSD